MPARSLHVPMEKRLRTRFGDCKSNGRVQESEPPVSYLCASLTLEEAAETERPAAPLTDVSTPGPQLDAAAGRSLAAAGR